MSKGWYGVDLDGTLAHYDHWRGADHIGEPVPAMVERVKKWLANDEDVRIFTARVFPIGISLGLESLSHPGKFLARTAEARRSLAAIRLWCKKHIGVILPVTCTKDFSMIELWDDRAVQVIANTGMALRDVVRTNAS